MEAKTCPHCGAVGYGWSQICWQCGSDVHIPPEHIVAAEAEVIRVAGESAERCREVAE